MKCVCGTIKMSITLPSKQDHRIESLSKESGVCMVKKVRWGVPVKRQAVSEPLVDELAQNK